VNPIGPRGVYDEAKRYAEALTMAYLRQQGVDTCIARIFNTSGPKMRPHDGRAIPTFLRQAMTDKPLTVFGDGRQTRDYVYVGDVARASFLAATRSANATGGGNSTATEGGNAGTEGSTGGAQRSAGPAPGNPFAALFQSAGINPSQPDAFGMNPEMVRQMMQMMGGAGAAPATPQDNRPPEERYADQLRQLNDMGFFDFDRNIAALRRSGGSVQGAVEYLLTSP
jgi:hypothetical protein